MSSREDVTWNVPETGTVSYDAAQLCVLMDIRRQLKELNRQVSSVRGCPTVLGALAAVVEAGKVQRRKERERKKRRKARS